MCVTVTGDRLLTFHGERINGKCRLMRKLADEYVACYRRCTCSSYCEMYDRDLKVLASGDPNPLSALWKNFKAYSLHYNIQNLAYLKMIPFHTRFTL